MAKKRFDEDFKKQLVKIYNQGNHSYRSLGEEYGVSAPTIRTWVLRYNDSKSFNIDD
ncbi:MAG: transposase, partial [Candidatus Izemoplasmatales bacterium]|nr:transposase [Candidatus Izemoplasmatales bacterium]